MNFQRSNTKKVSILKGKTKKNEELQKWIEQAIKVVGREYFKKGEILLPNL